MHKLATLVHRIKMLSTKTIDPDLVDNVLLHMVKYVFPNHIPTVLFFDDGSTTSIITHKLAGFLGLKGKDVTQWIEVAGKEYERYDTKIYKTKIYDIYGVEHNINLYGLNRITSNPDVIDVEEVYRYFPHIVKGSLDRPDGEVGILIGQNYAGLLPSGGSGRNCMDNLRVMDSKFGSGFVLGGRHPNLKPRGISYTEEALKLCHAKFVKNFVGGQQVKSYKNKEILRVLRSRRTWHHSSEEM